MNVARKVKNTIKNIDPGAKVCVFGSAVNGTYTGASDIDILMITKNVNKKYEIMVEVYSRTEAPVELHIVTPRVFERWYKRFMDENSLVEV